MSSSAWSDAAQVPGSVLAKVVEDVGTPCWVYDAAAIRAQVERLRRFDVIRYAQKACSNTHILRMLREWGVLVDAVSIGEVERALRAGYDAKGDPSPIIFTADVIERRALERLLQLDLPVNVGSPQMLEQVGRAHPGHRVWVRINPGFGHGHSRKTNTGGEHSKHGIWHEHLGDALALVDRYELQLEGLHMHIGSGVDYQHLQRVCDAMVDQVLRSGRDVRAISAGGGLPVPYQVGDPELDTDHYFELWDAARKRIESELGHAVRLEIEPGRFLVANAGALVSELRAMKQTGKNQFALVDAGFNDLMRPSMYGSYHHISVFDADGRRRSGEQRPWVVAGPLCESGDVFTQTDDGEVVSVDLPSDLEVGDLVVFHEAGAYGAAMSSNYNSRPLAPEVLVEDGRTRTIRRRQTMDELLALEDVD